MESERFQQAIFSLACNFFVITETENTLDK